MVSTAFTSKLNLSFRYEKKKKSQEEGGNEGTLAALIGGKFPGVSTICLNEVGIVSRPVWLLGPELSVSTVRLKAGKRPEKA